MSKNKKLQIVALMYVPVGSKDGWPRIKLFSTHRAADMHAQRMINGPKHIIDSLDDCHFLELSVNGVTYSGIEDVYVVNDSFSFYSDKQYKQCRSFAPHRQLKIENPHIEEVLEGVKDIQDSNIKSLSQDLKDKVKELTTPVWKITLEQSYKEEEEGRDSSGYGV